VTHLDSVLDNFIETRRLNRQLQLIKSLYQPNPPDVIARIQQSLSRLQSGPDAWNLAYQLLERSDEKVQFFAVLTFIIKLNTERYLSVSHPASDRQDN
jgi:hypothetical protein